MHGAMFVEGARGRARATSSAAVRELVGPDLPIAASYDLHGNVSQRIVDALDMFSTYRTAPHIDIEATMRRAVTMLVRALETGERPGIMWAKIPVVLPGERTSTEDEPAKRLYAGLPAIDAAPEIWDASLMVGYVWADEPRATAAAIMTGTDRAASPERPKRWPSPTGTCATSSCSARPPARSRNACARRSPRPRTRHHRLESGDNPTGGGRRRPRRVCWPSC